MYADNDWDEIVPHLFMGGHDRLGRPGEEFYAVTVRVADEFDTVISLYERKGCGPADGVEHHRHLFPDGHLLEDDAVELKRLAQLAALRVAQERRVLVRCQAGLNRSGLVVAMTLMALGYEPDDAIDLIRERRSPHALFNGSFVDYLRSGVCA